MFLKERQDRIVELVNADGRVTVTDLAARFEVTEDCIRKDLKQLDAQGLLQRVYGGAVSVTPEPQREVTKRLGVNTGQKRAIAEKAYAQIGDNDLIFLDVSTTNLALAELLATGTKHCTVVSNMIDILQRLAQNPQLTVVCTGGNVNLELNGFLGVTALEMLRPLHFDRAFLGALAVDLATGDVLTYDIDDARIKELVVRQAKRSYLMADTHKFQAGGNVRFVGLSDLEFVVCDHADAALRKAIEAFGPTVL